ncbi:MAG: hypothetical protein RR412_07440, partial [Burkholderiaceae bacterium]
TDQVTDQATDQARPNIDRTRVSKSTGNTLSEAGSHWPGNGAQAHARRVPLCVRDEARHCRRRAPRRLQCCQTTIPLQAQRGAKKPAAGFATDRIQSGAIEKRLTEHLGHVPPPIARGKNIWCT